MSRLGPVVDWVFWSLGAAFATSFVASLLLVAFVVVRDAIEAVGLVRRLIAGGTERPEGLRATVALWWHTFRIGREGVEWIEARRNRVVG